VTSQKSYTFNDVLLNVQIDPTRDEYPTWEPRPNTRVYLTGPTRASVFVYGSRIATLFADGNVKLLVSQDMSNTVRNRLNDVLEPLGWRLHQWSHRWYLLALQPNEPVRIEYITGMIIHPAPITNNSNR